MSDTGLYARYLFVKESDTTPALSALVRLEIPTGKYENGDPAKLGTDLSGFGYWELSGGLLAKKTFGKFNFYTSTTVDLPFSYTVDGVDTKAGKEFNYHLNVEYVLPRGFDVFAEINGYTAGRTDMSGNVIDNTQNSGTDLTPGIGWRKDNTSLILGYSRSLCGRNSTASASPA